MKGGHVFIKVCGLQTEEQIDSALALGYDAIGVVTYPKSRRFCPPERAAELAAYAGDRILSFVVGMTWADVREAAPAFDYVQIYEQRQLPNLALASKTEPPGDLACDYFFYDASAGSGEFRAFPAWIKACPGRVVVAGGLDPGNVCGVIRELAPFGVDVSSGVEKEGVKDFALMEAFIRAVRQCG